MTNQELAPEEAQARLAEIEENFGYRVRELEREVKSLTEQLTGNIQWLIDDLQNDLKSLEQPRSTDDDYLGVNSLGLIQGLGDSINREVVLLAAKKKELSSLKRVMRHSN